jgi:hypothetical protein
VTSPTRRNGRHPVTFWPCCCFATLQSLMIPGSCNGAQDTDILLPTTLLCPRFDPLSCLPILAVHSALISITIFYTDQCSASGMHGDVPVTIIRWPAVVACAQAKATDPAVQRRLRAGHRSWRPEWSRRELQRCLRHARPGRSQGERRDCATAIGGVRWGRSSEATIRHINDRHLRSARGLRGRPSGNDRLFAFPMLLSSL